MKDRPNTDWKGLLWTAAPLVIVAACALTYSNALEGPFVFDDLPAIVNNDLLPPSSFSECFSAPVGSTASGRPVVALSFALNHALCGDEVLGWHATSLILHLLSALALFGLARETLARMGNARAASLAATITLAWALHPILTDAVNLVASRSELFVSLFYLLVLYCLTRSAANKKPWVALCVSACALGMASKEVMVSAPLVAFAWDRYFLSGSWSAAWKERRGLYLSLASTWIVLGLCAWSAERGESISLAALAVSPWESLCTQAGAITHYLRLLLWPGPLSIDYAGWPVATGISTVLPQALLILGLISTSIWRLRSGHRDGLLFLGALALLAPSSSVIPLTGELVAEHRMYLASAPLIALLLLGLDRISSQRSFLAISLTLCLALGITTQRRNQDWSTELALWSATTSTRPDNARAWNSLGVALKRLERAEEAESAWKAALSHDPSDFHAHGNLGGYYARQEDAEQAIFHFREAVRLSPENPELLLNLGSMLFATGAANEAEPHLVQALRVAPRDWKLREKAERRLAAARRRR
jgi:protein O-mannosyl-transferase